MSHRRSWPEIWSRSRRSRADEELGEAGEAGYEASVQPSSAQNVVLKRLGAAEVMLKRNDWRLGGGGLATRRGAAVVEMQYAIFLQAFADAFGVRVFMLCVVGKSRKLRVTRVEPRPGRRVLINGYAVAHLGGVAFDSITRHHEVIEIQSDDEEEEEEEEPEREPSPEPPPRKRARRARVKTEVVKAERC